MKLIKIPLSLLFVFCFSSVAKAQYIQVDDTYTKEQLVEDILINSNCANVSNITVSGFAFGSGQSYCYFNAGTSTFPFQEGIILSTGKATSAVGPNSYILSEGPTSWPGDSDLQNALQIGNTSINATVLEFDFLPLGDKISFDYIFSSEQYLSNPSSNQCNYTDGFVFLLKEANSSNSYQNLAVIPGTSTPVRINTVRGSGTICPPANEQYFDSFNGTQHPTNFNGQTVIMTAEANVVPGTLYHIKLVVADQGNNLYDSAIFLGGGSFKVETDLGNDRLLSSGNPLCENETLILDATNANATGYQWYKDNVLLPLETAAFYTVQDAGTYAVEVALGGTCFSPGEIIVEYAQNPIPANAVLVQCNDDNDGLTFFNLNQANEQIIAGNPNLSSPVFFLSQNDAIAGTNPIANVTAFENTQNTVYARTQNQFGCFGISEVTLTISNNNITNPDDLEVCDEDSNPADGFSIFNLTDTEAAILANLTSGDVKYYTSYADALSGLNAIQNPQSFQNTIAFQQPIFAKLSTGNDCYGIATFDLIVNSFGNNLNNVNLTICSGNTLTLNAGNGFSSYSWNTSPVQNTQAITVSEAGIYTVTVTNSNGCEGTKSFIVTASSIAEVAFISVDDFHGGNNSATINLSSNSIGNYEYSLDGINYQSSPTFTNLDSGLYAVFIKEELCGQISYEFFVLDYPRFFTPNHDGTNDFWRIPFLQSQPNATVAIFDRYGKLIRSFKGNQQGWNGTFKGKSLPATDYWFLITLETGRQIRGHFSLLR